jgi:arsenite methyltransferase
MAKARRKVAGKRTKQDDLSEEDVRAAVKKRYAALAQGGSCCGSAPETMCHCGDIYPKADIISLPEEAIAVSAGCGNPTAIAKLKPGMTVVDLGSGGGIDVFLSAKKVGPKGKVYGIDATPEMIHRARKTARENGYTNVEFRLGEIEHIPLHDEVADVVISNCVVNLSPDKEQVFREAHRVLKPGGKIAVSDVVLLRDLPDEVRNDLGAWAECVSGAVVEDKYISAIKKAGFSKVKIEDRAVYTHEQMEDYLGDTDAAKTAMVFDMDLSQLVASYKISAVKPSK